MKTYRVIGFLQTPSAIGLEQDEVYIEHDSGAWRVYLWIGFADLLCDREGFKELRQAERWAKIWIEGGI